MEHSLERSNSWVYICIRTLNVLLFDRNRRRKPVCKNIVCEIKSPMTCGFTRSPYLLSPASTCTPWVLRTCVLVLVFGDANKPSIIVVRSLSTLWKVRVSRFWFLGRALGKFIHIESSFSESVSMVPWGWFPFAKLCTVPHPVLHIVWNSGFCPTPAKNLWDFQVLSSLAQRQTFGARAHAWPKLWF